MSASFSTSPNPRSFEADRGTLSPLEIAIVKTVAYTDVFDFPLTRNEIFRYLIKMRAVEGEIDSLLSSGTLIPNYLRKVSEYFTLPGREEIVNSRIRREAIGKEMRPIAFRFGNQIGNFPFVKMAALTGALAANNSELNGDLDYFIVTEPGRLWVTRGMILLLVRYLERKNIILCPNYLVSENALELSAKNLFTARELTQMIPLSGLEIYSKIRVLNQWTNSYLPNAIGPPVEVHESLPKNMWMKKSLEILLRSPIGSAVERWEMNRKIQKFSAAFPDTDETNFSPDCCQGHFDGYGKRTMDAFTARLSELGISL